MIQNASRPSVAFLGTGLMGGPMARNILRADLFRGLLAHAGDLDHSGLLVEL